MSKSVTAASNCCSFFRSYYSCFYFTRCLFSLLTNTTALCCAMKWYGEHVIEIWVIFSTAVRAHNKKCCRFAAHPTRFLYQLIYGRLYNLLFHCGDHPFPVSTAILNIHLGLFLCGECSVRIAFTSFMYLCFYGPHTAMHCHQPVKYINQRGRWALRDHFHDENMKPWAG